MYNFEFQNPTKLIFGKGTIARIKDEIPAGTKLMLTFGGGSVKKNGVYEQVIDALKGYDVVEFWGIEPNPKVETLRKAIELGKRENVDFILAVGGGSTLDGTKLIACGIKYDGDAWELVLDNSLVKSGVQFASVMTMPATGSEMNSGAVISNLATKEKFAFYSYYPKFSILDPEVTYSIPEYQVSCGIADTFVHVMEQYLTTTGINSLMDRWAEGLLMNLIDIAPGIAEDHKNYDLMSQYMLSATMGLNGFIAMGVPQDWATHMIGHELTALHGVTHGESLAIVLPATMTVLSEQKKLKILQYGERVWGITEGSESERITKAIEKTEQFFRLLGLKTRLHELNIGEETIAEIERRFNERGVKLGECKNVTGTVARAILECAL
ncbi:MAG: iron-containing alcohol dehydrogenase [bacterium]|uniref:Iron-containing alcohol dehydrogenase n=1 Tax=Candidatus Aphodosoma intestinipullorum TaxID=2840674 RepID=A0A940IF45_9BACT|nr:iron-containing alcohol dehydrogenase [Candidatus Aphodosoma intestinipullorum]